MSTPRTTADHDGEWESVHKCPRCGHVLRLATMDLKIVTSGVVKCPSCGFSGPIEIEVVTKS